MEKSGLRKRVWAVVLLGAGMAIASPAQTLTTLVSFDGTNGNLAQTTGNPISVHY